MEVSHLPLGVFISLLISTSNLQAATLSKNPEARIIEIMNMLFDKLYRWEKEWGNGMRWIDTQ
jgi:hypothetical protein